MICILAATPATSPGANRRAPTTKYLPIPGKLKICSTIIEPVIKPAEAGARYSIIGNIEALITCFLIIYDDLRPLDFAVLIKLELRTSIVLALIILDITAI